MIMEPPKPPPNNVYRLRLKKTKEDPPTAPVKKSQKITNRPWCITHFFEFDKEERTVTCSLCERSFDPMEALELLARDWSNYDYTHRDVRGEIKDLQAERERIKKQVVNLKAQRRRLVPGVRQDVEWIGHELWRHEHEKNPEIRTARMRTIRARLTKIESTLNAFGDDEAKKEGKVEIA